MRIKLRPSMVAINAPTKPHPGAGGADRRSPAAGSLHRAGCEDEG